MKVEIVLTQKRTQTKVFIDGKEVDGMISLAFAAKADDWPPRLTMEVYPDLVEVRAEDDL